MLPEKLSNFVCSLMPGEDCLAFSVVIEVDVKEIKVVDVWFGETIIHSKKIHLRNCSRAAK